MCPYLLQSKFLFTFFFQENKLLDPIEAKVSVKVSNLANAFVHKVSQIPGSGLFLLTKPRIEL